MCTRHSLCAPGLRLTIIPDSFVQAMKAGDGDKVIHIYQSYSYTIFCLLQGCADVDDLVVATRRQEQYIITTETDQTL